MKNKKIIYYTNITRPFSYSSCRRNLIHQFTSALGEERAHSKVYYIPIELLVPLLLSLKIHKISWYIKKIHSYTVHNLKYLMRMYGLKRKDKKCYLS